LTLRNSAANPLGPFRNRSSALELLPTLHPEGRGTDATELDAVLQPVHPGVVVVVPGDKVVEVDGDKVVEVDGPKVVEVADCDVLGGVVGGGEVVVLAGGGAVVGVGAVVLGLPGVVVVVTFPPGAALGTVVGLVWWLIILGTTRPATRATTSTAATTAITPTTLSRPPGPRDGPGPGAAA
jgi:hypothetical protein